MLLFSFAASAWAGITVKDDLGREVRLAKPAQRIVSLAPFLTELAYSAGAGGKLVGVSAFSDYPPEARALPQVSSAVGTDLEAVAALRPDLVLAWRDSTRSDVVERLQRMGIAVFVAEAHRLDDAARLLALVGMLAGTDAGAAARRYQERLRALRERHAGLAPMPVFVEIWHRPLTTVAGTHWINDALAVCGARNAFDDLPGVAPQVPVETLYAREPRAIVGAGSAADAAQFLANWRAYPALAAVRAGRLVFVDPDLLQRPTLRLADGVAQLCEGLDRARRPAP